jgi:hypothetical protein
VYFNPFISVVYSYNTKELCKTCGRPASSLLRINSKNQLFFQIQKLPEDNFLNHVGKFANTPDTNGVVYRRKINHYSHNDY